MTRSNSSISEIMRTWPAIMAARAKVSRNFDRMMPPGVMIDVLCGGDLNEKLALSLDEQGACVESIYEQVASEGDHRHNPYHNFPHFLEVDERVDIFVTKAETAEERFAALLFPPTHDMWHPGKGLVRKLTVEKIYGLYGGQYPKEQILNIMNLMINRDNELLEEENALLPEGKRKMLRVEIGSQSEELNLTLEEMHGIRADSFLVWYGKKTGKPICLRARAILACLIKASDFVDEKNLPKTALEWQMKLADMANFVKPIEAWLDSSVRVNLEASWPAPKHLRQFVENEFAFLDTKVWDGILNNPETTGLFSSRAVTDLEEKMSYYERVHNELCRMKVGEIAEDQMSAELVMLREIARPLFADALPPLY